MRTVQGHKHIREVEVTAADDLTSWDGFAGEGEVALQAYRPRWHIEDDTYRELKEGWGLENSTGDVIWRSRSADGNGTVPLAR